MQTPGPIRNPPRGASGQGQQRAGGLIVLVGATVRAAAESARIAGFSSIAVDHFGDRETLVAAESWIPLSELQNIGAWQRFSRSLPPSASVAIVGGLQGGYGWIDATSRPFYGAGPTLFLQCDSPERLRAIAHQARVAFPKTQLRGRPKPGWLLKRFQSSGGLGVSFGVGEGSLPADAFAQERVPGRVCGASYLGLGNRAILLGVCRSLTKRIGTLPFVHAGAIGPLVIDRSLSRSLQRLGDAFVAAFGHHGPFNIDVAVEQSQVCLLEINPRWSASMEIVELAWSDRVGAPCSFFDSAETWIDRINAFTMDPMQSWSKDHTYLKRVLFARCDRLVSPRHFDQQDCGENWVWKDVPGRPTHVKRRQPIATLIARMDRLSLRQAFRVMV